MHFCTFLFGDCTEDTKDFPVSLRYSVESKMKDFCYGAVPGEEYTEVGRAMPESEKAAKYLQDAGYDMLNADNGTYDSWYWCHPPMYMPQNCNLEDVAHIKKFVDDWKRRVPLIRYLPPRNFTFCVNTAVSLK